MLNKLYIPCSRQKVVSRKKYLEERIHGDITSTLNFVMRYEIERLMIDDNKQIIR